MPKSQSSLDSRNELRLLVDTRITAYNEKTGVRSADLDVNFDEVVFGFPIRFALLWMDGAGYTRTLSSIRVTRCMCLWPKS